MSEAAGVLPSAVVLVVTTLHFLPDGRSVRPSKIASTAFAFHSSIHPSILLPSLLHHFLNLLSIFSMDYPFLRTSKLYSIRLSESSKEAWKTRLVNCGVRLNSLEYVFFIRHLGIMRGARKASLMDLPPISKNPRVNLDVVTFVLLLTYSTLVTSYCTADERLEARSYIVQFRSDYNQLKKSLVSRIVCFPTSIFFCHSTPL